MRMRMGKTVLACVLAILIVLPAYGDERGVKRRKDGNSDSGERLALVIGNGSYAVGPLRNPPADARLIAGTLEGLGFKVKVHTNLDYRGMNRAIDDFGRSLKNAETGLFFFAGHGIQFDGRNYLMPVDADVQDGNELRYRAVDAGLVMAKMERAANPVNVVVLDACRNNPFARSWRSAEKGLAQMDAPPGTKIIYATRPGDVAEDGKSNNSPFTESLAKWMKSPDRELEQVIREVYREVYQGTGGGQSPWAEGILVRDVYLARSSGYHHGSAGKGLLTIRANVPGAHVWLDGRDYGEVPRTFDFDTDVDIGVRVTADGYVPYEKRVKVRSNEDGEVMAILEKRAASVPTPTPAPAPSRPDRFTNSLKIEFVRIPAGSFTMGSPPDEPERGSGETQHRVTLTRDFFMGTTEVTVGQWKSFVDDTGYKTEAEKGDGAYVWTGKWEKKADADWRNPYFDQNDSHPVTCVSWNDVQVFIKWLNRKEGKGYRLPTEAQWEYAARAGTTTPFTYGDCLSSDQANYGGTDPLEGCPKGEYRQKTVSAGSLNAPNSWGLHDMHGNVWEWCEDWYGDYPSGSVTDPTGPSSGAGRVLRGGGWDGSSGDCRSAFRGRITAGSRFSDYGFRLVLPAGQQ